MRLQHLCKCRRCQVLGELYINKASLCLAGHASAKELQALTRPASLTGHPHSLSLLRIWHG